MSGLPMLDFCSPVLSWHNRIKNNGDCNEKVLITLRRPQFMFSCIDWIATTAELEQNSFFSHRPFVDVFCH